MKVLSVFYLVQGITFGRTLQLIKLTALYSIYGQNKLNLILESNVASFDVRNFLLILYNKENVTFTWPARVQIVLCLTIIGDKFVIYVPIRRYPRGNGQLHPVIWHSNIREYEFLMPIKSCYTFQARHNILRYIFTNTL